MLDYYSFELLIRPGPNLKSGNYGYKRLPVGQVRKNLENSKMGSDSAVEIVAFQHFRPFSKILINNPSILIIPVS